METGQASVGVWVYEDPEAIVDEWEALAERVGTVFSSRPSFVTNAARANELRCEYVTVSRGGRLVALAALSIERKGPVSLAKVVGTTLGVPLEFLSEDADASDRLLTAVASRGYMLSADSVIDGEPTLERLRRHPSWTVDARVRERVLVIDVPSGSDATDIRSRRTLKRLRQYRQKWARESSLRFEVIADAAHLDRRWRDIIAVAADAVRGTDKLNYLVAPHGEFARAFLRDEAHAGRLCITGLVIDGVWSAHEVGLRTRDRMEGWVTHYDARVARVQPGHQLIEWFANNHDRLDVRYLDQGVGVNDIKSMWGKTGGYDVVKISAVPSAWLLPTLWVRALLMYPAVASRVRRTRPRPRSSRV